MSLVLTRKVGETVVAGEVKFTVVSISGGRTKIAVDAPRSVRILRGEIAEQETKK